jgi:hypothetical protein
MTFFVARSAARNDAIVRVMQVSIGVSDGRHASLQAPDKRNLDYKENTTSMM